MQEDNMTVLDQFNERFTHYRYTDGSPKAAGST
jgi:hypothetical protein